MKGLLITAIIFISGLSMMILSDLKKENLKLRCISEKQRKFITWQKKRLKSYYLITLKLNEITDTYQSSRNLKLKDKELITKMNEL